MLAVIDYNAGNLTSVVTALRHIGVQYVVTSNPGTVQAADKVIFPGVGEAQQAMTELRFRGLDETLKAYAESNKPLLGICLGAQILQEFSVESNTDLLGLIPGSVKLFPGGKGWKVPQIGWNTIIHDNSALFKGIRQESSFYFVHSYYLSPHLSTGEPSPWVCATSNYGIEFAAALHRGNIWGTQFHPEKSGPNGLAVLKNFIDW